LNPHPLYMIVQGRYSDLIRNKFVFLDECTYIQHLLAKLRLQKHKGKWLTAQEYFKLEYDKPPLLSDKHKLGD